MNSILKMQNNIQTYAWGSRTAIARIMGRPSPSEMPEAELWLGAHPKSPSSVWVNNRWQPLNQWIAQAPEAILGPHACKRFNGNLPYLLKILAAAHPLSIQAHPSKEQARRGYEREEGQKIPMDAPHRNYKDRHHKPECICALTPFWALCGFRSMNAINNILRPIWPNSYSNSLDILNNTGLAAFFKHLMSMNKDTRVTLINHIIQKVSSHSHPDNIQQWMVRLQAQYPGDAGVISPALLNLILLQPGEAIALEAGQLHAYLDGIGIELMANSDNVLRGGLTPKHIDIPELMKVLSFDPNIPEVLSGYIDEKNEKIYQSKAEEFVLSVIETTPEKKYIFNNRPKVPEILLCTDGEGRVSWKNGEKTIVLEQGHSVFVTAAVDHYTIEGAAVIFKATLNTQSGRG